MQVRGPQGGMLVQEEGSVRKVKISPAPAYLSWHPNGRMLAFATIKVRQFFHSAGPEVREVIDLDSCLGLYFTDSNTTTTIPQIAKKDRLETYPTWSPDGRFLYFCSAPVLWTDRNKIPYDKYGEIRYDLKRIGYDPDTGKWGSLETVLSAADTGLSILQPRISPDGRFLVFVMCSHGCFPVFRKSSDLYIMDLKTLEYKSLDLNSPETESWHCWPSNSRWLVFSSKRANGLFSQPFFSFIDANGKAAKPFVLPQEDPAFYDGWIQSFNIPELVREPMKVRGRELTGAIYSPAVDAGKLPISGATPGTGGQGARYNPRSKP
jgi:hypothetical protein